MTTKVNTPDSVHYKLKVAYEELPAKLKIYIRETIMEECEFGYHAFYSKVNGRNRLKRPELVVIENVFQRNGIDLKLVNDLVV